jgi:peptide/nickel transport system permease protein
MSTTLSIESAPRRRLPLAGIIGSLLVVFWVGLAALGAWLAPYGAGQPVNVGIFAPISAAHPFGTDYLGRDMVSRVLHGARYTVGVAFLATLLACLGGISLGLLAAVRRGWIDAIISRAAEALISVPHLMFALVVVAAFGTSLPVLVLMAAVSYVPGAFRISRALALDINAMDFIQVARARGEGTAYILRAEILPNMIFPVLTDFGLRFVFVVLLLSGLSFLGLGIQPPNADWGALVRENIEGIHEAAPAVVMPALAIGVLTIGITLLIDGLAGRGREIER